MRGNRHRPAVRGFGGCALALLLAAGMALPASGNPLIEQAREAVRTGNYAIAYCIWNPLARNGDADAQFNLGWLFHNGYGLAIDDAAAERWWLEAAQQGHRDSQLALGTLYRLGGRGVAPDPVKAANWLVQAARAGDEDAPVLLATMLAASPENPTLQGMLRAHPGAFGSTVRIAAERANLRRGPGTGYAILRTAKAGDRLVRLGERGNWVQVAVPETGRVAWVFGKLIDPAGQ